MTSTRDPSRPPNGRERSRGPEAVAAIPATRICRWCRGGIPIGSRRDAVYCSKSCRQAAHRFGRGCVSRARATDPLRLAYADPPYPGKSRVLYRDHPDYGGEVDHAELIGRLADGYDAWALSTSTRALPFVLELCCRAGLRDKVRVAAWVRGAKPTPAYAPLSSWEPVVYTLARPRPDPSSAPADSLVHGLTNRATDPGWVVGAKPAAFIWWLFDLLAALPGDELDDLYPGSGGVGRAWQLYTSRADDARDRRDASRLEQERIAA